MKVIHIVPGSGDTFYCQNCLRDLALVRALRQAGVDVAYAPMYLPPPEAPGVRQTPVFYGAVSVYLEQKVPAFGRRRGWLHRLLDAPALLRAAARRAGSTDAGALEDLTASVLRGEDGRQAAELEHLLEWLRADGTPDVVHLSNALLLGLARKLRAALGCAVVCSLQDEDVWVDAMPPAAARRMWDLMAERARDADHFLPVSRSYAAFMGERLRLAPDRMTVVPPAVTVPAEPAPLPFEPPVIGFLARMTPGLGLDELIEAWLLLRQQPGFAEVRLRATGGQVGADREFVAGLRRRIAAADAAGDAVLHDDYDPATRHAFLAGLTVLSVPSRREDALGLQLLEAIAAGVPVVQPRRGAFGEIVESTGGGRLADLGTPAALAATLEDFLRHPDTVRETARLGRARVAELHAPSRIAGLTLEVYRKAADRPETSA